MRLLADQLDPRRDMRGWSILGCELRCDSAGSAARDRLLGDQPELGRDLLEWRGLGRELYYDSAG